MGFFSSIGNAFKSVGKAVVNVGKGALSVVKTVATPLLSTAASMVPGIGPLLAAGVDALGNKLLGSSPADVTMDSGQVEQSVVTNYLAANTGAVTGLGSSPIAQAMSSAVAASNPAAMSAVRPGFFGTLAEATGIGDGKPGVFGIGDGKPGVFGIGTGKNAAKKQAAEVARAQAEAAAKGEGLEPKIVTLRGDVAAAEAEAKVEKQWDENGGTKPESGSLSPIALAAAALLALLAL